MTHHHHNHTHDFSEKGLYWALIINVILTFVQFVGGVLSGSLSLIADALHNFSDAGALGVAALARRISKIPPNESLTYGYKRAEILGALINSTLLLVVGVYLIYEATQRYFNPQEINGRVVVGVAGVALVIDVITAMLTYAGSKESINLRAAFIHNVSDALASVVVIISGLLIIFFKVYYVDVVATVLISVYIIYHAYVLLKECILILMQSVPEGINIDQVQKRLSEVEFVKDVHHVHIWRLDDKKIFFEGHISMSENDLIKMEEVKSEIRKVLKDKYDIDHSTLEFEICESCNNKH